MYIIGYWSLLNHQNLRDYKPNWTRIRGLYPPAVFLTVAVQTTGNMESRTWSMHDVRTRITTRVKLLFVLGAINAVRMALPVPHTAN